LDCDRGSGRPRRGGPAFSDADRKALRAAPSRDRRRGRLRLSTRPEQADAMTRQRDTAPKFLNLFEIRFPVGAIASIGHRISGVLLILALPLAAQALERSLHSEAEFRALLAMRASPWASIATAVVAWAIAHHLLAGIRHLLM